MAEQQCPLIAVPIKVTEQVDLAGPVKTIITNSYGEDPSKHADHLNTLNRARQDAVKEGGAGNIATQRDLLYKYFHVLELLELRFPELRIPFPWKDAFTKKPISQFSIAYEKASVIFNIASTLSSFGATQGRHAGNPDGLKRAYTSFRQAAGMFSYINENFLHAPSTDMSRDIIKALVDLMLAQASEVFLEKSVEERKANGLVAKIASYTANMYTTLGEEMKEWVNKSVFDRLWLMMIQVKAKYFASVTQYYRALADDARGEHGVCLVRLTLAESLAREASRLMAPFNASLLAAPVPPSTLPSDAGTALTALVSTHLALCTGRKEVAIKDNDLIYHDILPSESALETVDKFAAASPISIQDIYATPEVQKAIGQVDLFSKLVPLGVHESASLYSEEKAKLARSESERHDIANGELQAALEYMGLPGALNIYRNKDAAISDLVDPGPDVMKWAEEEANGGGARGADGLGDTPDAIDTALHQIGSFRLKATQDLDASATSLDEETRECEKSRVKYDYRWTQEPSGTENKELRQELKLQREALNAAKANDEKIEDLWNHIKGDVQRLVKGRDALEQAFAEVISAVSTSGNGTSSNKPEASLLDLDDREEDAKRAHDAEDEEKMEDQVRHLETLLAKLPKIKKERGEVLGDLKERIQTDDISHLLILNRRNTPSSGQETSLFQAELEKFKPHQQRIALSIKQQTSIVAEVTEAWKEITESPSGRRTRSLYEARKRARVALVDRLRKARDGYAEVRAAVHRGLQFYEELGAIAGKLHHDAEAFVRRRRADAQKLANELEWDAKLHDPSSPPDKVAPSPGPASIAISAAQTVAGVPQPAPSPSAVNMRVASTYSTGPISSPVSHLGATPSRHQPQPPPPPLPHVHVPATSAFANQYANTFAGSPAAASSPYSSAPPPLPQPQQQPTPAPAPSPLSHFSSPPPSGPFPPPPTAQSPAPGGQNYYTSSPAPSHAHASPSYPSAHSLSLAGLSLGNGTSSSPSTSAAGGAGGGLPPPPPQPFVSQYNPSSASGPGAGAYSSVGYGSAPPAPTPLSAPSAPSPYGFPPPSQQQYHQPPPPPPPQQQYQPQQAQQYQHHQPQQHQQQQHQQQYASPTSPSAYGAPPPPPGQYYQQQHPPPPQPQPQGGSGGAYPYGGQQQTQPGQQPLYGQPTGGWPAWPR
ncbi:bck1-like resistance to osmotic shock [Tilletia horrida]|nr:bck1-like resistance to osmotic shock [Tilletia horrida]